MSTLKVNSIIPVGGVPTGGGGGIVQIVTATHNSQVSQSSNGSGNTQTTLTDTGLTASITPTSTSNKVLVMVEQHYGLMEMEIDKCTIILWCEIVLIII